MNLTTNPLLLALVALAVSTVVLLRRSDAPWARSVSAYFVLAAVVIGIRVFFQVLLGSRFGTTVLLDLPQIPLPQWAAGVSLGGPVTAEALAFTVYDGLRLGVMLLCLGAANALANPRQALRSVPAALYEASVAVVIALSVAPQLIESAARVRRAQRLRGGGGRGLRALNALVIPVLADAVDRSMTLAAGMESRGFGRTAGGGRRRTLAVMLVGSMVLTLGAFLVLGEPSLAWLGFGCLAAGGLGVVLGLRLAGRRLRVTRYRPHPWSGTDTLLAAAGLGVAAALLTLQGLGDRSLTPGTDPLTWPELPPAMLAVAVLVVAPVLFTPTSTAVAR